MKVDIKFTEILTLPNIILLSLSIATGLILFLPYSALAMLHLVTFQQKHGSFIGGAFILFSCLWGVNTIKNGLEVLKEMRYKKKFFSEAGTRLKALNEYQKAIIFLLYSQPNYTHDLPVNDGAVRMLESNYMIGKIGGQYMVTDINNAHIPYLLQPWVIQELKQNIELLNQFEKTSEEFETETSSYY